MGSVTTKQRLESPKITKGESIDSVIGRLTSDGLTNVKKAAEITTVFLVPFTLALFMFVVPLGVNSAMSYNSLTNQKAFQYSLYTGFFTALLNSPFFILLVVFVILTWFFLPMMFPNKPLLLR